jgi:hypothetical protein
MLCYDQKARQHTGRLTALFEKFRVFTDMLFLKAGYIYILLLVNCHQDHHLGQIDG